MIENEVLRRAVEVFGLEKQIIKCVEELSELQKELCKVSLGQGKIENVVEEVADVEIMIKQIKLGLLLHSEVEGVKAQKLLRLEENLRLRERGYLK